MRDPPSLIVRTPAPDRAWLRFRTVLAMFFILMVGLGMTVGMAAAVQSPRPVLLVGVPLLALLTVAWTALERDLVAVSIRERRVRLVGAIVGRRRPLEELLLIRIGPAEGRRALRRVSLTFTTGAGDVIRLREDDVVAFYSMVEERLDRHVTIADPAFGRAVYRRDRVVPRRRLEAGDADAAQAAIEAVRRRQRASGASLVAWLVLEVIGLVALVGGPMVVQVVGGLLSAASIMGATAELGRRQSLSRGERLLRTAPDMEPWDDEDYGPEDLSLTARCPHCGYAEHFDRLMRFALRLGQGDVVEVTEVGEVNDALAVPVLVWWVRCHECGHATERIEPRASVGCGTALIILIAAIAAARMVSLPTIGRWLLGAVVFLGGLATVSAVIDLYQRRKHGLPDPTHCPACGSERLDHIGLREPYPCPACGRDGFAHHHEVDDEEDEEEDEEPATSEA